MYSRILDLKPLLRHRSIFLFGARQTGKSTLLHSRFPEAVFFDLLEADTFRELSARPEYMRQTVPPGAQLVVIDEVQKLPGILDFSKLPELVTVSRSTSPKSAVMRACRRARCVSTFRSSRTR